MTSGLFATDPVALGPYRLLGRLGGGGMGQVYLGRSPGGRLVAVKVIRAEFAADPEFRHRFAREVANARNVSGIFTASVVDADTDGPVPWLATMYVPGPSLTDVVRESGPLPTATLLPLAAGLAEALVAIHAADMVHRDLKPSNVLLAADGPRVIDFGISHAVEATTLTPSGAVIGSPGYMSPEQARGEPVSPQSDVFSLGAVLAFAATGQGPFGVGSVAALIYRVVNEAPALDRVPRGMRPLVARCLAKDPGDRPSPSQLLAAWGEEAIPEHWLPDTVADSLPRYAPTARAAALAAPQPPGELAAPAPATAQPTETPSHRRATASHRRAAARTWQPWPRTRSWILAASALVVAGVVTLVVTLWSGALDAHPTAALSAPPSTGGGALDATQQERPATTPAPTPTRRAASRAPAKAKTPTAQPTSQPPATAPVTAPVTAPATAPSTSRSSAPSSAKPAPKPTGPVSATGATVASCSATVNGTLAGNADFEIVNKTSDQLVFQAVDMSAIVAPNATTAVTPAVGETFELTTDTFPGTCLATVTISATSGTITVTGTTPVGSPSPTPTPTNGGGNPSGLPGA